MRVYISGPIALGGTLPPDQIALNIERFEVAEIELRLLGHDPVNPSKLHGGLDNELTNRKAWHEYMRTDIAALVECDGILLLPRWQLSPGARLESHIAFTLGFELVELKENRVSTI